MALQAEVCFAACASVGVAGKGTGPDYFGLAALFAVCVCVCVDFKRQAGAKRGPSSLH